MSQADENVSHCPGRVFAILNPMAGSAVGDSVRNALAGCVVDGLELHETAPGDDVGQLVRDQIKGGVDLVIAAGGDGTVSVVADALAGSKVPLGIIPMGTANVLARELNIPLDLDAASRLLSPSTTSPRSTR